MKFPSAVQRFLTWLKGVSAVETVAVQVPITESDSDVVVAHPLTERLTRAEVASVRASLEEVGARARLVLDLSRVQYIDSVGMGMLIEQLREHRSQGGDLKLAAVTPSVAMILELMRLERVFDVWQQAGNIGYEVSAEDAASPPSFHLVG